MFCGSQVQKPYHASMNGFLTFCPQHHLIIQLLNSRATRKMHALVRVHLTTANQREIRVAYFALGQKNRLTGFRAKLIMVHGQLYKKYKGFLKWRKEQQDTFYG